MKDLKSRTKFTVSIIVLIFFIVGYQVQQQVKIIKEPPSKKWGKEVYLSSGKVTKDMKLIKYGDNYLAIHNDDFNYKLIIFDSLGEVIKENIIKSDDMREIFNLSLNFKDDFIYLNALTKGKSIGYLNTFKLNNNLQIISHEIEDLGINKCFVSVDENIFITSD